MKKKAGFTLVELLVVIAIIGILVGLLLPAVQAAREAARRMQCSNNLKQLALANLNYESAFKKFPPAFVLPFDPELRSDNSRAEGWGWTVMVMPFIEQGNLYDRLGVTNYSLMGILSLHNPGLQDPVPLLQTNLSTFRCPSDSGEGIAQQARHFGGGKGTNAGNHGNWRPGLTNYISNRGTRDSQQHRNDTHGMFMEMLSISMGEVVDGTSNTFCIGERDSLYGRAGAWCGTRNPRGAGSRGFYTTTANVRPPLNSQDPPWPWSRKNRGAGAGFSSLHTGGAQFAFVDGSVHFISENIEWQKDTQPNCNVWDVNVCVPAHGIYQKLGRRNDGLVFNMDL